jgi:hypothetical protein
VKVELRILKPGDRFKYANIWHVRVENCGEANAADIKLHTLVKLPWNMQVDIPPFDAAEEAILEDEIAEAKAQQEEDDAKGITMMDKIQMDRHPLDEED